MLHQQIDYFVCKLLHSRLKQSQPPAVASKQYSVSAKCDRLFCIIEFRKLKLITSSYCFRLTN